MLQNVVRWCLPCFFTGLLLIAGCTGSNQDITSQGTGTASSGLPSDEELKNNLDEVIEFTERRILDSEDHAAWQIMHGVLAYGQDLRISDQGKIVQAVDWLLDGGQMKGWNLVPGEKGLVAILEVGSKTGQGHADQWLAVLAQCHVPLDRKLVWDGNEYKFGDLVTQAQWDMYEGKEASWSLIGLGAYLPLDAEWESRDGHWNFERMIGMEAAQDLNGSACGGSHRLIGMTMTLNRHLKKGGKLEGAWLEADKKIKYGIEMAQKHQQPDGSFSTNYFARPASSPDVALKINTSGHTFEFLSIAMTDEQLKQPWMVKACDQLCSLLTLTQDMTVECGALYHAVHGLQIYRLRRFGPTRYKYEEDEKPASAVAVTNEEKPPAPEQITVTPNEEGAAPAPPQAPAPPPSIDGATEDTETSGDNSAPIPNDEAKGAAGTKDAAE